MNRSAAPLRRCRLLCCRLRCGRCRGHLVLCAYGYGCAGGCLGRWRGHWERVRRGWERGGAGGGRGLWRVALPGGAVRYGEGAAQGAVEKVAALAGEGAVVGGGEGREPAVGVVIDVCACEFHCCCVLLRVIITQCATVIITVKRNLLL